MRRLATFAFATLSLAGCDDPASIERTKLASLKARGASQQVLCDQAKRLMAAGDIIAGKYNINQNCLSIDPATDFGSGRDAV